MLQRYVKGRTFLGFYMFLELEEQGLIFLVGEIRVYNNAF